MKTNSLGEFNSLIKEEIEQNNACYFRLKLDRKSGKQKYTQYIKIDKDYNILSHTVLDSSSDSTYIPNRKSSIKMSTFLSNYSYHNRGGNMIKINKMEYDIIDRIGNKKRPDRPFKISVNDLRS